MKCRVCRHPGQKRDGIVLCRGCRASLERAVKKWMLSIERDLATMEAFDAYCAGREKITA
jgi:hypothetical protein